MGRILVAGFPEVIGQWLQRRLPSTTVSLVSKGHEALGELAQGDVSLLLIDHQVNDPPAAHVVLQARSQLGLADLPVMFCLDKEQNAKVPNVLRQKPGVTVTLFHPLEMSSLPQQVAAAAGMTLPKELTDAEEEPADIKAGLTAIWQRSKTTSYSRVALCEKAIVALIGDTLTEDLRKQAEVAAHKLAGMAGTFGFPRVTGLARRIEERLQYSEDIDNEGAKRLRDTVAALRDEMELSHRDYPVDVWRP